MRVRWELILADDADPARLRAAGEEALDEITRVEEQLSAFRPGSDLWEANRHAAERPVCVSPATFAFLQRAADLCAATGGAFDPTVGPLLACWGLAGDAEGAVPSAEQIEAARALVGMTVNVRLDPDAFTICFARPGVRLDPGALGKGWALERALDLLREAGVKNALLHGGTSTIGALGSSAPGVPGWTVAVQHPTRAEAHLATVRLGDGQALSVSAVHGKSFWAQGRRFGHVLDPRTGQPVQNNVLAAVIACSPTDTDALSTALLVLGEGGLHDLEAAVGPNASLLVAAEAPPPAANTTNTPALVVHLRGDVWLGLIP
jgi:thiamine biosynthesis lipoprotein